MSQMSRRGLLIFDLDGTLFRADAVTVPAVQTVFRGAGLPVPSTEKICSFIGKPSDDLRAWIGTMCPSGEAADLMEMISGKEISLIATRGALYPGVIEALTELRRTVNRMALCTNGDREYVDLVLKAHGLERFFDLVRFRRREDTGKPGMVRDILEQVSDRPAILIGDTRIDVRAGVENGVPVVAVTYGYGKGEELHGAHQTADRPPDVADHVKTLLLA